jgi:hypothetical protein
MSQSVDFWLKMLPCKEFFFLIVYSLCFVVPKMWYLEKYKQI